METVFKRISVIHIIAVAVFHAIQIAFRYIKPCVSLRIYRKVRDVLLSKLWTIGYFQILLYFVFHVLSRYVIITGFRVYSRNFCIAEPNQYIMLNADIAFAFHGSDYKFRDGVIGSIVYAWSCTISVCPADQRGIR